MSDKPQPLLGIIAALPAEARAAGVRRCPAGALVEVAENVLLIRCGMGRARAARAAGDLLQAGAGALLSWGTAAALCAEARTGDVLLPCEVWSRDGQRYAVDAAWRRRLARRLHGGDACASGAVAEADGVLRDAEHKQRLHTRSGASIADMESAAIAEIGHRAGVRLLVVRVVSDSATARIPACALAAVDASGELRVMRGLTALLAAPAEWLDVVRLARGFRHACAALSRAAQRAGPRFMLPPAVGDDP